MTGFRIHLLGLGLLTLCLAAADSRGQAGGTDLKSYRQEGKPLSGDDLVRMQEMRDGKRRTRGPDEKANKDLFNRAAQFWVYRVSQDQYYTGGETGELKPRTGSDHNMDEAMRDLEIYILVPKPGQRILIDQMNYIEDFGAALDLAIVAVLNNKGGPPPVIRINAVRMLAIAARSGAPSLAKTITALLTNQFYKGKDGKPAQTPPEVLYWALKSAEHLLSAPDPSALGTPNAARHTLKDETLVPLVSVLNDMVLKNPAGLAEKAANLKPDLTAKTPPQPGAPAAADTNTAKLETTAPKAMTVEQVMLIQYYRRQAIRALGQVRFDTIAEGTPNQIRPGFTLAKVAVSDASLNPPPSVSEVGEATIGLCGIHPSSNLNVDALLHVIATGAYRFFTLKAESPDDKSLAWKSYASRVDEAFALLQKNAQSNPRLSPFRQQINNLAGIVMGDVTATITASNGTGRPTFERLTSWGQSNAPKGGLYSDGNQYQLKPRSGQ